MQNLTRMSLRNLITRWVSGQLPPYPCDFVSNYALRLSVWRLSEQPPKPVDSHLLPECHHALNPSIAYRSGIKLTTSRATIEQLKHAYGSLSFEAMNETLQKWR